MGQKLQTAAAIVTLGTFAITVIVLIARAAKA
jgi:hypothetical protein